MVARVTALLVGSRKRKEKDRVPVGVNRNSSPGQRMSDSSTRPVDGALAPFSSASVKTLRTISTLLPPLLVATVEALRGARRGQQFARLVIFRRRPQATTNDEDDT